MRISIIFQKFPLTPMGVLAPGSAHARPSAQPPIDVSGNFPAHVSGVGGCWNFEKFFLSTSSPNQAILSTFLKQMLNLLFLFLFFLGGGGKFVWTLFSINFLTKSSNAKHFSFFHFFLKINKNFGHYVCLASPKIVVTIFACYLHKSSGMCLHLARKNMSQLPAGSEQYFS